MSKQKYSIKNILFTNPILNASGCWAMSSEQINKLENSNLGGIIAKTCTKLPKNGNAEPTYYCLDNLNIHFNSKGLPSNGYEYYKNISRTIISKPFILSIAYSDDLFDMLIDYDSFVNRPHLVEINMSCPNTESEIIPYDLTKFNEFIEKIKCVCLENLILGIKLPPYLDKKLLFNTAKIIIKSNISFITLCNSLPNCLALNNGDYTLSTMFGGMSGKFNKYISISNVKQFADVFKANCSDIKIIGCGGIECVNDVDDYIKMGADFVQLGSCFYNSQTNGLDLDKITKIVNEFDKALI